MPIIAEKIHEKIQFPLCLALTIIFRILTQDTNADEKIEESTRHAINIEEKYVRPLTSTPLWVCKASYA